jgi:hypothetical protein
MEVLVRQQSSRSHYCPSVYFWKFLMKSAAKLSRCTRYASRSLPRITRIEDDRIDSTECFWDVKTKGIGGIKLAFVNSAV